MDKSWKKYCPNGKVGEKLRRRIYKGIPRCYRGLIWMRLLGVQRLKEEQGSQKYQVSWVSYGIFNF